MTEGNEGRVEICFGGQWGTVCHSSWDNTDATVVCRQLGFGTEGRVYCIQKSILMYVYDFLDFSTHSVGAVGYRDSRYGWGTGPVYLDDVRCRGSEKSILDCSTGNRLYFGDVYPACKNHATDASVYCPTGK